MNFTLAQLQTWLPQAVPVPGTLKGGPSTDVCIQAIRTDSRSVVAGDLFVALKGENFDGAAFLLQAQTSGAKVIGLANAGGDTVNSIKAAAEFGLTRKQNLAALLMLLTDVHAVGLDVAQGLYLTEAWYWDLNNETRQWASRYEAQMKRKPNSNHASVYSSVMHYLKAVQAAGTDDTVVVNGRVKRKWREGKDALLEIEMWSENSKGVSVGPGSMIVTLPSRSA